MCKEVTVSARENVPSIRFFIHLYARPGQRPFTSRRGGGGNINFKIFCRPFPRSTLAPFFFPTAPTLTIPIPTKAEARKSSRPVGRGINLQSRKQDGALSILLIKCQQLNCAGTSNGRTAVTREGGREQGEGEMEEDVRAGVVERESGRVKGNIELVF